MGVQRLRVTFLSVGFLSLGLLGLGACGADEASKGADPPMFEEFARSPATPANSAPGNANGAAPSAASPTNPEMTQVNQLAPTTPGGAAPNGTSPPAQTPPAQTPPAQMPPAQMPPSPTPGGASAGCGVSQGMPANPSTINDPNTIVTFPGGYDGSRPFPLLFGFHGAGRTNMDMRMVDSRTPGSQLEANYVVAFVKSQGNAWDLGTDYPRFERLLDQLLAQRCIDTSAIFAMGHSSGAQFIVQMLGDNRARETRFAAVAPVSSSRLNNPVWDPVPTLLIHGLMDTQRPNDLNGAQDILQYAQSNRCGTGTQPLNIGTCSSLAMGAAVNPGCVQYSGCAEPTLFCNHNDPNYLDNGTPTNHGWPCFANQEIFTFFESVR